jgi:hypothetical protein
MMHPLPGHLMSSLLKLFQTFSVLMTFACYVQKRELLDLATVSDQEIKNDDVVYMVFQKETGSGWEDLQVDTLVSCAEDNDPSVS